MLASDGICAKTTCCFRLGEFAGPFAHLASEESSPSILGVSLPFSLAGSTRVTWVMPAVDSSCHSFLVNLQSRIAYQYYEPTIVGRRTCFPSLAFSNSASTSKGQYILEGSDMIACLVLCGSSIRWPVSFILFSNFCAIRGAIRFATSHNHTIQYQRATQFPAP
eukprot:scaffold2450_cov401-Prasinococcus_capsulatus_cf.AAC.7